MQEFKDLEIGDEFKIPSYPDHSMEPFRKMRLNRAMSLDNGRVEIFPDLATVWTFE